MIENFGEFESDTKRKSAGTIAAGRGSATRSALARACRPKLAEFVGVTAIALAMGGCSSPATLLGGISASVMATPQRRIPVKNRLLQHKKGPDQREETAPKRYLNRYLNEHYGD